MSAAVLIFVICAGLIAWTFILYPVVILGLARFIPSPSTKTPFNGKVTLIVAAHNEEAVIGPKLDNCLALDFGDAESEIIVISDGSVDRTEAIMKTFTVRSDRLVLLAYQPRAGKANALNVAVQQAKGDVLIFTDANVFLTPSAPKTILSYLADSDVGAVSGKVVLQSEDTGEIAGEGMYMKFENRVQEAEATFHSMVGVDGAFYCLRREFFRPLDRKTILDDFILSMGVARAGKRIVFAGDALGMEQVQACVTNEFTRKTRIFAGGFSFLAGLGTMPGRFNAKVWFMLVSHKILRWLAPIFLVGALVTNLVLWRVPFWGALLVCQLSFYLLASLAAVFTKLRNVILFYVPYYFCMMNLAAVAGMTRFSRGRQGALWEKVGR